MIYHLLPQAIWTQQAANQPYRASSLVEEGFIHCTAEAKRLVYVANTFYSHEPGDFVILCIDEQQVQAPVRWERADDWLYPHIYGPLNLDAIHTVLAFPRTASGEFLPPPELAAGV